MRSLKEHSRLRVSHLATKNGGCRHIRARDHVAELSLFGNAIKSSLAGYGARCPAGDHSGLALKSFRNSAAGTLALGQNWSPSV